QADHLLRDVIDALQNMSDIVGGKMTCGSLWKTKLKSMQQGNRPFLMLARFYRFHCACLRSTFSINRIYGSQLFVLLLYSTPVNTYIIMSILMNRLPKISIPFFTICLLCKLAWSRITIICIMIA